MSDGHHKSIYSFIDGEESFIAVTCHTCNWMEQIEFTSAHSWDLAEEIFNTHVDSIRHSSALSFQIPQSSGLTLDEFLIEEREI